MAPQLSNRDLEIVAKAFQCFKNPEALKLDYDKLAELTGLSNGRSANASWLTIKKKLIAGPGVSEGNGTAGEDASTAKAKAAPKKRASKAKATADADAPADGEETPTTSPVNKGGKRKAAAMDADSDKDAIEEPTAKPKRKYVRKPKDPNAPPAKRGKKAAKAGAEDPENDIDVQVKTDAGEEDVDQSAVIDGIIKEEQQNEGDLPANEDDQALVNGEVADDELLGTDVNDEGIAV